MRKVFFVVIILFLSLQVIAKPVNIAIIKRGKDTLWTGEMAAYFDQLKSGIKNSNYLRLNENIYPDKDFKIPFSIDFAQIISPVNLFEYHNEKNLDLLLFVNAEDNLFSMHLLEFPSGIVLNEKKVGLQNLKASSVISNITSQISIYENLVNNQWGQYGVSFENTDFGILLFTDDSKNILLSKTLDVINNTFFDNKSAYWNGSLKYKMISSKDLSAMDMANMTNQYSARFALDFSKKKNEPVTMVFPYSSPNTPALQVEYPHVPLIEPFFSFQQGADQFNPNTFCSIVLNDNGALTQLELNKTNLPLFIYRTQIMHHNWVSGLMTTDVFKQQLFDNYNMIYRFLEAASPLKPWIGLNFAAFCRTIYSFDQSIQMLDYARASFRALNDQFGENLCRIEEAKQAGLQQQWSTVEKIYQDLLNQKNPPVDSASVAEIHYNLGLLFEIKKDLSLAILHHEKSVKQYAYLKDTFRAMLPQSKLSYIYRKVNALDKAEIAAKRYLAMANGLQSEPDIARARYELGLVHLALNNLQTAKNDFIVAKNYFEMLDDKFYTSYIDLNLGVITLKNKQYVEANPFLQKALQNGRLLKNYPLMIDSYRYLGELEAQLQNWNAAQQYFDNGVNTALEINDTAKLAEVLYQQGLAHIKEGKLSIGFVEVKKGIELSDGRVHGGRKQAQAFIEKLEQVIANKRQEAGF